MIERVFLRLSSLYGSKFADLWKGSDMGDVKSLWAEKLGMFAGNLSVIGSALDACDEKPWPPTLPEFLGLCREASARARGMEPKLMLAAPELTTEQRLERKAQLESAASKPKGYDYRGWCKELRERYLAGECLLVVQIEMASSVLGEDWKNGLCTLKGGLSCDGSVLVTMASSVVSIESENSNSESESSFASTSDTPF